MDEKRYTVSEAVRLIGVESHVLRYWEEELKVPVERTKQGHRSYSRENIELFQQVKVLRERGLQMKAIRAWMGESVESGESGEEQTGCCEIVVAEEPTGSLEVFTALLKQMMEEVARAQDERLERIMEECIRGELEELYLQYFQALAEAAAAREKEMYMHPAGKEPQDAQKQQKGWLKRLLRKLFYSI